MTTEEIHDFFGFRQPTKEYNMADSREWVEKQRASLEAAEKFLTLACEKLERFGVLREQTDGALTAVKARLDAAYAQLARMERE